MKLYGIILSATLILAGPLFCKARTLTPAEVAEKILEASPATQGDILGINTLSESLKTENNLPDPEIEGEYLLAAGDEKNRWGAGISWGLEWPGVYSARKSAAKRQLAAAESAAALARRERLIEIKRLLLNYVLVEKQMSVLEEINRTNDSIMELSRKAENHGELTRLDINKLRLEQASVKSNMSDLTEAKTGTLMQLSVLYGSDCTPLLSEMTCEFPEIRVPVGSADYLSSPQVMTAQAEAESAKSNLRVADTESLPGISIGYQHAFEDGTHFNGATLGLSIPLFSPRNKKSAARAAIVEAEFKAEKTALDSKMKIEGNERRLMILLKQIEEMATVVEDNDNTGLLLKAYRGGVITLVDYLNERNYFTNAELDLLSQRHAAANLLLDIESFSK